MKMLIRVLVAISKISSWRRGIVLVPFVYIRSDLIGALQTSPLPYHELKMLADTPGNALSSCHDRAHTPGKSSTYVQLDDTSEQ